MVVGTGRDVSYTVTVDIAEAADRETEVVEVIKGGGEPASSV